MAVDSRAKGQRGEYQVRDALREKTGYNWERVPGSGAYGVGHGLKGDVYLPAATGKMSKYTIEVKWYKEEQFNSNVLKDSSSQVDKWLDQTYREADEMSANPMLIFKKDKAPWIVAIDLQEYEVLEQKLFEVDPQMQYSYDGRTVVLMDFKQFLAAVDLEDLVK